MLKREGKKSLATEARHYVEIQRVVSTPDTEGGFTETWYVLKSCWAAIYPIRALQRFEYKSLDVEATHFFRLRGYIDCIESDRIVFDDRAFEVLTVENIQEKDVVLFVVCKEIRKEPGSSSVTGEPGLVIYSGSYLRLDQTQPQAVTGGSPTIEGVQFNTTPTTSNEAEGLLRWNSTDGTLDLGMSGGDVTMQVGQEMFTKVRNVSGATILNGSLVYFTGRQGNRPTIGLARGDALSTSCVVGMTTQDIANQEDGYITTIGYVRQIDTRGTAEGEIWAEGHMLWLSTTLAGHATNVEPSVPNYSDIIGTIGVRGNIGIGSILLNIVRTYRLEELKDVNGTPLNTSGQLPVWDNDNEYFDFTDNVNNYMKLDQTTPQTVTNGTPIFNLGIASPKLKITPEGGIAVLLTNRSGAASVKGYLVHTSNTYDNAVQLVAQNDPDPIGVFYESGIADGSEAWVVTSGIADVYFTGSVTRGNFARGFVTSDGGAFVAGQATSEPLPTSPFATDKHFYEIGHVLEARTGAGLVKVNLHFN